jgi:hypothetical protein
MAKGGDTSPVRPNPLLSRLESLYLPISFVIPAVIMSLFAGDLTQNPANWGFQREIILENDAGNCAVESNLCVSLCLLHVPRSVLSWLISPVHFNMVEE